MGFGHASLYASVAAPPTDIDQARVLTAEHYVACPDWFYVDPSMDWEAYPEELMKLRRMEVLVGLTATATDYLSFGSFSPNSRGVLRHLVRDLSPSTFSPASVARPNLPCPTTAIVDAAFESSSVRTTPGSSSP